MAVPSPAEAIQLRPMHDMVDIIGLHPVLWAVVIGIYCPLPRQRPPDGNNHPDGDGGEELADKDSGMDDAEIRYIK